ncbi:MFS transporter [Streptomyces sp. NPDC048590]|uniref:MFS transporter n=1 Tax=Streptomyces sp. NPDC048590 TaxID=3365574 RepID=UPI00370FFA06
MTASAPPAETSGAPRRTGIFRDMNFVRFWGAVTVSGIGSQVTLLALPLTAVLTLRADAFQVGLLTTLQMLPVLFVTPFAGVMADRFPVRLLNSLCDLLRGFVLLSVPVMAWLDSLTVERLYVVALVLGCLKCLADVAHHSMLPHLVDDDRLVAGNAAVNASYSVTNVAGPGLGGALIQLLTAPFALLVDVVSFLLSGALIASLRTRPADPDQEAAGKPSEGWWRSVAEGFRYLVADHRLLFLGLCSGAANLFIQAYATVLVIFVVQSLGLSATVLGIVYGCGALGGVAGAMVAKRVGERFAAGTAIVAGLVCTGVGIIGLTAAALVDGVLPRSAVLVLGTLVYSAGVALYNVHAMSTRQRLARRDMLGRVTASYRLLSHGALPLGSFLGGLGADRLGAGPTIALAGVGVIVWVGILMLTPFRRLQQED